MTAAGVPRVIMKTLRQRQLNFLGHVTRLHDLENLAVTGKVDVRRGRAHQRLKYLDSLCTCMKDKVSPVELIRARRLWHHMVTQRRNMTRHLKEGRKK